ncbi:protein FAM171A1 isoform X2 [Hemiscyllium ocellatum]|uniref:protein FAM171A1 isoform X2 n=1 Tax=Hemiscyllium ocellatum TaxID=170820 RepID=UPI0029661755|nr:protein FAM171A1 isoform X2 [Hemiscyllium ocellatum]
MASRKKVTLKVHVSDSSTHQPLGKAFIEIFANQTSFVSGYSEADGVAFITFRYTPGVQLLITASKRGYVPNSSPWLATKLPLFSSVSLLLHPERSATLMVYEDVVQIVSGFQGALIQPRIQFQRRSLNLPKNSTYRNLVAFLTVAATPWEVGDFPYLQGIDVNRTGNSSRFQLTPVTAVSVHLLNSDGTEIQVNGPICVTIPLPAKSSLKPNDALPAWKFDKKIDLEISLAMQGNFEIPVLVWEHNDLLNMAWVHGILLCRLISSDWQVVLEVAHGAWLKSGLGLVQREGDYLTWTYFAPQLGYWVAAMSPQSPGNMGPVGASDITVYHTAFLLAILGGMTVILLVLLCLLIYYCRRKCLKPRQHHRKIQLSSALDSSKKDQATSMSHLNLISAVHMELVSSNGEADVHTPMLKPSYSTSREFSSREELISHKDPSLRETLKEEYCRSPPRSYHLKMARSIDVPEDFESSVREDYRKSYNSVVSQPLLDKRDKEVQASIRLLPTDSKSSIQEPDYQLSYVPDKAQKMDRKTTDYMMSRSVDHLERPTSFPQPGQLLCCSSADEVNDNVYRKVLPTLVIPAHYMKLPMEYQSMGQPLSAPAEQQLEFERLQAELSISHQQMHPHSEQQATPQTLSQQQLQETEVGDWSPQSSTMSESVSIPASLSEAAMAQMNSEVQLFAEKALLELTGGKPLPHPRAWFVSLDGRANAQVRHSYIDLQKAGKNGSNDASLDSGVDMNEPKPSRKGKEAREQNLSGSMTYTRLVYVDDMEQSGSESGTAVCSPEDTSMKPLMDGSAEREGGTTVGLQNENIQRIEEMEECLPTSPQHTENAETDDKMMNDENDRINDNDQVNDDNDSTEDQDEDKKSPWQKREERPLMAFNLK